MTFLAEWGDRSQITTIILSSREVRLVVIKKGIFGEGSQIVSSNHANYEITSKISVTKAPLTVTMATI